MPFIVVDTNHTILGVVTCTDEVVHLLVTAFETDVVVLHRTDSLVIMIVPVEVSIILVRSIVLYHRPRPLWVLGNVIEPHPEFRIIGIGISGHSCFGMLHHEDVAYVRRPESLRDKVVLGSRGLPSGFGIHGDLRCLAFTARLGSDKNDTCRSL